MRRYIVYSLLLLLLLLLLYIEVPHLPHNILLYGQYTL